MAKYSKQDQEEARQYLASILKPGQEVQTIVTHVARSGMSRSIKCYTIHKDGLRDITYAVARVQGATIDQSRGGMKVGGCGMDMGFHVVYSLSRVLFRDGFRCAGRNCGSNDHSNARRRVDRDDPSWVDDGRAYVDQPGYLGPMPRDGRSKHRGDGGYALNQRWI